MSALMILRTSATSPFGRKVKLAVAILGIGHRVRVEKADPWSETDSLREQNPLGKMPVLLLEDGGAVYDSRVILDYLDLRFSPGALVPSEPAARLKALRAQALGDGIIEAALLATYERLRRPAERTHEDWIAHQRGKILRALDAFERDAPDPARANVGSIALACALGYLDWRRPVSWREERPGLVAWLDAFAAATPAYGETERAAESARAEH